MLVLGSRRGSAAELFAAAVRSRASRWCRGQQGGEAKRVGSSDGSATSRCINRSSAGFLPHAMQEKNHGRIQKGRKKRKPAAKSHILLLKPDANAPCCCRSIRARTHVPQYTVDLGLYYNISGISVQAPTFWLRSVLSTLGGRQNHALFPPSIARGCGRGRGGAGRGGAGVPSAQHGQRACMSQLSKQGAGHGRVAAALERRHALVPAAPTARLIASAPSQVRTSWSESQ